MSTSEAKPDESPLGQLTPDASKAGYCIFCGKNEVSEEHFWPNWMAPRLRDSDESRYRYQQLRSSDLATSKVAVSHERRENGPLRSQRPEIVCNECNNGWMSAIENRTKPILEGVCWDGRGQLSVEDQLQLATWLTLKTITGEYNFGADDSRVIAIPDEQRERFWRDQSPFQHGWQIYVGAYKGEKSHRHRRQILGNHAAGIVEQASLWCGDFYATVIADMPGQDLPPAPIPAALMDRIWPSPKGPIRWQGRHQMGDDDADRVYNIMKSLFAALARNGPGSTSQR